MTNPDELERAVERLTARLDVDAENPVILVVRDDLRLILSANREMREQVEAQKRRVERRDEKINLMRAAYNRLLADTDPAAKARSALTTQRGDGE